MIHRDAAEEAAVAEEEEEELLMLTMASSTELRMDQLPSDPLLHILSYLDFRDLVQYVPANNTRGRKPGRSLHSRDVNKPQEASGGGANRRLTTTTTQSFNERSSSLA